MKLLTKLSRTWPPAKRQGWPWLVIAAHIKCKLTELKSCLHCRSQCRNKLNSFIHLQPPLSGRDGGEEAGGDHLGHVGPERPLAAVGEEEGAHVTWEQDNDDNDDNDDYDNNGQTKNES